MAETSGFFEAVWDETLFNEETQEFGDWDRKYLSEQFAKYFALFIGNGVFGSPTNQLKVIPGTGLSVIVTKGWAFINGHWYYNDSNKEIPLVTNATSNNRIDTIRVRYTDASRNALALAFTGDTTLVKSETIYDLQLATVVVPPLAVTISASNITDTRMNESVCGFVTQLLEVQTTEDLFAQYNSIFNDWFETVKDQVTGDLAIRLQSEFVELNQNVVEYQENVTQQIDEYNTNYQQTLDESKNLVEGYVYNDYITDELEFIFIDKVCEIEDSRVTLDTLLDLYFTDDTIQEAEDCKITIDSSVSKYILKAKTQPSKTLKGRIRVRINSKIPQLPPEFDEYTTKSYVVSNYYNKVEIDPVINLFNLISSSSDVAATHNSIVIHKDITEYYTDGTLWGRIAGTNGFKPFEGIYPGMYFDTGVSVNTPGQTNGTSKIMICGLNMHWNNNNQVRYNHLTCCPLTHFGIAVMNNTNTTVGGYVGSKMFKDILGPIATEGNSSGTINEQLYAIFGEHLKTIKEILSNSVNNTGSNRFGGTSGCSNNWEWKDVQSVLFSEIEAYGSIAWSSSGYDIGCAKKQMPVFMNGVNLLIPDGIYWWLKDVASAPDFCYVDRSGAATHDGASKPRYCRPRFVIA